MSLLNDLEKRLDRIATLDADALEAEHIAVLGRKNGELSNFLKTLPTLPPEERRTVGAAANQLRQKFETAFEARRAELKQEQERQGQASIDLTMPGRERWIGSVHPVTRVVEEIAEIFRELGFARVIGPEAETEWYNFIALNFPPDHPAMDLHDTLYLETKDRRGPGRDLRRNRSSGIGVHERRTSDRRAIDSGRVLLRTHTSPVQIRTMLESKPPIRVIMPGLVYRKDTFDASHAPAFSQVEGLAVDENITFADLKATLTHFARRFFSSDTKVRFRPSFFPFTEPSAEMDVSCALCKGAGCPACKGTGWMEILGCGMVHPNVLETVDIDPEVYSGFAFGMGPHRIAMQRYGIPDIRILYEGDMRFLSQFS
ncbi:MAG: phenylalanine--tRNA ligase subunit alpha [Gemmatimonadota bacterium]